LPIYVRHVDRQFFSVDGGQKEYAMAADEKVMVGVPGFDLEGEKKRDPVLAY
jgi:hypothetical protein